MKKKFPQCMGRSEIKRLVHLAYAAHPIETRIGQSVCNTYDMGALEASLWEDDNFASVVQKIYENIFHTDYQNM